MDNEVRLRNIEPNDLPIFYEQQLDADATRVAGNIGSWPQEVSASSATGSARSIGARVSRPGRSPLSCTS